MAPALVEAAGPFLRLIADKAYDTNSLRNLLAGKGIEAVIPSIRRRKPLIPYDTAAYRDRNLIEGAAGWGRSVHAIQQTPAANTGQGSIR